MIILRLAAADSEALLQRLQSILNAEPVHTDSGKSKLWIKVKNLASPAMLRVGGEW
jgi:hypothetical protein